MRALDAYIRLMRGANSVQSRLMRRLAAQGLTENQFGVLEILLHLGPQSPGALKAKLLTTGGNVTMVLDNLEGRGLVERRRDAEDGRRIGVQLTPEGRRLTRRVFPGHVAAIVEELSVLEPDEQVRLGLLCRRLGLRE